MKKLLAIAALLFAPVLSFGLSQTYNSCTGCMDYVGTGGGGSTNGTINAGSNGAVAVYTASTTVSGSSVLQVFTSSVVANQTFYANQGIVTSTITASTTTISGEIILPDGTIIKSTSTFGGSGGGSGIVSPGTFTWVNQQGIVISTITSNDITTNFGINSSTDSVGSANGGLGVNGEANSNIGLSVLKNYGSPYFGAGVGIISVLTGGNATGSGQYAVAGQCSASGKPCYGGYFSATGGASQEYALYTDAANSSTSSNYGLYVNRGQVQIQSSMTVAGTATFQNGVIASTMTVSTQTVSGEIVLKDGTIITSTSPFGGSFSINSVGNSAIVSSATLAAGSNVTLSQLGNTITIAASGSGGGSGGYNLQPSSVTLVLPLGINVSTIQANAFNSTASSFSVTGPGGLAVVSSSAGQIALAEGSTSTVVGTAAGIDSLWADSVAHTFLFNPNNTSTYTVVGSSIIPTMGHLASWSGMGFLVDNGIVLGATAPILYNGTGGYSFSATIGQSETITGSSFTVAGIQGLTVTGATTGPLVTVSSAPNGVALVQVSSTPASVATDFMLTVSSQNGTPTFAVKYDGDLVSSGTTPGMGTCGTSPSVLGTDTAGVITIGGGVVTSCTMNWANTKGSIPVCVMSTNSTAVTGDITTTSTSSITFGFSATLGGGTINYLCFGNKG